MPINILFIVSSLVLVSSCITDPGVSKKRGLVADFSVTKNEIGCNLKAPLKFLILPNTPVANESDGYVCTSACPAASSHQATTAEITEIKKDASITADDVAWIDASAGVCLETPQVEVRPTNQIDVKSDFCSCIGGKSDLISDCAAFCTTVPTTVAPTLYLKTIIGADIALNTKLGNLANWCSVQLVGDTTAPQCFLSATDGTSTIANIAVSVSGNSLTANIQSLGLDKTYIVKIVEGSTGSNAQSKEFQLRRKTQVVEDTSQLGVLKISPINQYSCIGYGGTVNTTTGVVTRTSYTRNYYYFAANETPPPMPPAGGTNQSMTVCHDEQLHPGSDNAEYPRFELIPQALAMWDKSDSRFVNEGGAGMIINKTLTQRLLNEYGISANISLFTLLPYANRPSTATTSSSPIPLGMIMVPFVDKAGKTFCPTQADFNAADQPLYNLLKEYMDDTEGLYFGEKEAETILDNNVYKTIYGTMLVTESTIKKYGFYYENGLKVKADQTAMNSKTIYYYWPTNDTMDPLSQGNRKLFTVRSIDTLNGGTPTGLSTVQRTSDKRIGCVPKSVR